MGKWNTTKVDCLVLALVLAFVCIPQTFIHYSHHVLGKILFIFIILHYTEQHFIYGFAACVFVILYYYIYPKTVQELVESFSQLSQTTQGYVDHISKPAYVKNNSKREKPYDFVDGTNHETHSCGVTKAYPEQLKNVHKESEQVFRKEHCNANNVLVYKEFEVHNHDIAHHVSDIEFTQGICNPCDPTCHFSLRKQKEETEDTLKPEFTKMISGFIPEQMRKLGLFTSSGEPFTPLSSFLQ
jgi:hypothetical protein